MDAWQPEVIRHQSKVIRKIPYKKQHTCPALHYSNLSINSHPRPLSS